jgi:Rad3-related DNA helicase
MQSQRQGRQIERALWKRKARLRFRHLQVAAYFSCQEFVNLAVARDRRGSASCAVYENCMPSPLSQELATMRLKVPNEVDSPHA